MSFVTLMPQPVQDAASGIGQIGTALEEANVLAGLSTAGIVPAGADEVSATVAALFNTHGQVWQGMAGQAAAFQQEFVQALAGASSAYQGADLTAEQMLWNDLGELVQPLAPLLEGLGTPAVPAPSIPNADPLTLVIGGTGEPVLPPPRVEAIQTVYHLPGVGTALFTPEQFLPVTPQLGNLTLGQSLAQGTHLLDSVLQTQIGLGHTVNVWASSQGSVVVTDELRKLMFDGAPGRGLLHFVLTGDPNNPDGGAFERFVGLYVPGLDVYFNGATPANAPYAISIFTKQYDPVADFPQYPLNLLSDANAISGMFFRTGVHGYVTGINTGNCVQLPTSPGYTGSTIYYMALTQNLPLLGPLRCYVPAPYGNALADLLQPNLRVIVDMGYGSGEYANIPTPASLFELPDPFTIIPDLAHGTVQGLQAAMVDLGLLPQSYYPTGQYPFSPVLDPNLNFPLPQSSVTGLSLLTGYEGQLMKALELVPLWDQ